MLGIGLELAHTGNIIDNLVVVPSVSRFLALPERKRGCISKTTFLSFAFVKIPRIGLSCKLFPVLNPEHEPSLLQLAN